MARKKVSDDIRNVKEPAFIVKPVARNFGMDYLHLALLALVVILVALLFAVNSMKPVHVVTSCSGASCALQPQHNASQAISAAEHLLPYYANINSTASLLPYYSIANESNASYIPSIGEWMVRIPYIDPLANDSKYNLTIFLGDNSLNVTSAYITYLRPISNPNLTVTKLGSIDVSSQAQCASKPPYPVYFVTDPYAPGALQSLKAAIKYGQSEGSQVNMSYYFVIGKYALSKYQGYGAYNTDNIARYLTCASRTAQFSSFVSNLTTAFDGSPLSNATLLDVVLGSGENSNGISTCLANATQSLNYQSELVRTYHITSTPIFVVDCKYVALPQTLGYAVNSIDGN